MASDKNTATWMAVLELVDQIYQGFENNEFTIGIFVDLKKAFDTVNHQILLNKLEFYGVRGIPLTWIKSYLSDRQQYVQINNSKSSLKKINCGVPQGSVLGPLLFLIYINDIFNCSKYLAFILFADDTNIFAKHKNTQNLMDIVNTELKCVASWLAANKLTLHPDKTKFILFHPARKQVNLRDINLSINGTNIDRVEHTKFLGIVVHQNLSWVPHIQTIQTKISKALGIISKTRQFFDNNTLRVLYNSLILPYLLYCNLIWASTYPTHIQPLFILQKKAARIITNSPPRTHSQPLFDRLNILTIFNIYKLQISCFVFSHINKLLPNPLSAFLKFNQEYHDHNTRHKHDLHKDSLKYKFAIRSQAPNIWNSIPLSIRQSLKQFNYKRLLKSYFLHLTY